MHASVVTCGSEYFRGMLEHEMAESASGTVELQQVLPGVFGRVLHWLYTGELGALSDVPEGLASAARGQPVPARRADGDAVLRMAVRAD